jgi:hypothetical protein
MGKIQIFSKSLDKSIQYLKKSWLSQFISMVLISLHDLDKNINAAKSWLKSLNFKNIDREKIKRSQRFSKVGLDTKDILDLDLDWSQLSRPPGLVFIPCEQSKWAKRTCVASKEV